MKTPRTAACPRPALTRFGHYLEKCRPGPSLLNRHLHTCPSSDHNRSSSRRRPWRHHHRTSRACAPELLLATSFDEPHTAPSSRPPEPPSPWSRRHRTRPRTWSRRPAHHTPTSAPPGERAVSWATACPRPWPSSDRHTTATRARGTSRCAACGDQHHVFSKTRPTRRSTSASSSSAACRTTSPWSRFSQTKCGRPCRGARRSTRGTLKPHK
mmetsp:Transcript_10024/g.26551  ORF Transcript_10024/g.26551 Transcript_10024/m.26551 type:complete len:212 (-) Transcript_10024:406-1041(-)